MPKNWVNAVPNITKFERVVPGTADELWEKLKLLGENWSYVKYCGVYKPLNGIFVDLGPMGNTRYSDFYNPLKQQQVTTADTLVQAIVYKVENNQPIVLQDAVSLFATMETP